MIHKMVLKRSLLEREIFPDVSIDTRPDGALVAEANIDETDFKLVKIFPPVGHRFCLAFRIYPGFMRWINASSSRFAASIPKVASAVSRKSGRNTNLEHIVRYEDIRSECFVFYADAKSDVFSYFQSMLVQFSGDAFCISKEHNRDSCEISRLLKYLKNKDTLSTSEIRFLIDFSRASESELQSLKGGITCLHGDIARAVHFPSKIRDSREAEGLAAKALVMKRVLNPLFYMDAKYYAGLYRDAAMQRPATHILSGESISNILLKTSEDTLCKYPIINAAPD